MNQNKVLKRKRWLKMQVDKFKFAGVDYLIIDVFEYEGIEYMYIFEDISKKIQGKDLNNLEEEIEAKADFVYQCEDGMYENVVDDELYTKLMSIVNKRNMTGQNQKLEEYYNLS